MNKADLIAQIVADSELSRNQAQAALDATIKAISSVLAKGEKVTLVGFGTFQVAKRAPRMGRNPKTNKEVAIPERNVVKFKAGKELAENL